MNTLGGYIATIVVSLLIGYLAQFLQPKSKLICWSLHNFFFDLKNEGVVLQTNSLTVQNVGHLPAEEVEIIHKQRPDFFEIFPPVEYTEAINPNNEHVIKIRSLGPREWLVVQLLSYKTSPALGNIRWKQGQAKWVQTVPQLVQPRWWNVAMKVLLLVGAGSIVYWLIRAAYYFAVQNGYLIP